MDINVTTGTAEAKSPTGGTAGMIADYGMLVVVGAVFLGAVGLGIRLLYRYFDRMTSGKWLEKEKALEYVKETYPGLLKKTYKELPDLRDHPAFAKYAEEIRTCAALHIHIGGFEDRIKTSLVRDIVQVTLKAHRTGFAGMLQFAYSHQPDFDSYFGDARKFHSHVSGLRNRIERAVKEKMADMEVPSYIFDGLTLEMSGHTRMMASMLDLAAANHDENYWRMNEVLNSEYAWCSGFREAVAHYIGEIDTAGSAYTSSVTKKSGEISTNFGSKHLTDC